MSQSQTTASAISMNLPTRSVSPDSLVAKETIQSHEPSQLSETIHSLELPNSADLLPTLSSSSVLEPLQTHPPTYRLGYAILPESFPELQHLYPAPYQLFNSAVITILLYVVLSRGHRAILRDIANLVLWCRDMTSRIASRLPHTVFGSSGESPLKSVLGIERSNLVRALPGTFGQRGLSSLLKGSRSSNPPGLGNWDNSCYQNSVIQGLASLSSLPDYLRNIADAIEEDQHNGSAMNGALLETTGQLNSGPSAGQVIWLPRTLKTMSTWQQQDAQEYFSKILDQLDKESVRAARRLGRSKGLAMLSPDQEEEASNLAVRNTMKNPLEGLIAQRVGCLQCGYSEGLSFIPFNCLTVPLGSRRSYDIRECLDEYSTLERIDGVECPKCTILHTKGQLENLLAGSLSEAFKLSVSDRLRNIDEALQSEDFSDSTLIKKCVIPKKSWKSSTKSKQTVIGRPPKNLVIHVNRSLFNEYTGAQMKNYADVRSPLHLDLGPWCIGQVTSHESSEQPLETWESDPRKSMLPPPGSEVTSPWQYELRASIMHYGRHENGHYVCFRKYPAQEVSQSTDVDHFDLKQFNGWWRLSDESVSQVSQEQLQDEGEVFMLFYERKDDLGYDAIEAPPARVDWLAEQNIAIETPLPEDDVLDFLEGDDISSVKQGEPTILVKLAPEPPILQEDVSPAPPTAEDTTSDERNDDDGEKRPTVASSMTNISMASSSNTKKRLLMRTAGVSGSRDGDDLLNGLRMVSAV